MANIVRPSLTKLFKDSFTFTWRTAKGQLDREGALEVIGLLAFLVPSIVDPFLFALSVKADKDIAKDKKQTMILQNNTHHLFNLLIEVAAMLGAKPLVGYLAYKSPKVGFYQKVAGFVGLMAAKSLIRPFVMIEFSKREKAKNELEEKPVVAASPAPVMAPPYRPVVYAPLPQRPVNLCPTPRPLAYSYGR